MSEKRVFDLSAQDWTEIFNAVEDYDHIRDMIEEEKVQSPDLTDAEWERIYEAIEAKIHSPTLAGDRPWKEQMRGILSTLAPIKELIEEAKPQLERWGFQDPDEVGDSQYRALYELLEDVINSDPANGEQDDMPDFLVTVLGEVIANARAMQKQIKKATRKAAKKS